MGRSRRGGVWTAHGLRNDHDHLAKRSLASDVGLAEGSNGLVHVGLASANLGETRHILAHRAIDAVEIRRMSQPIRSMAELLNAMRARRDYLDISHETIDAISGVPSGYTSKLFAPIPTRGIGYKSLGDVLGALGMALVPVEDPEAMRLVRHRWAKRGPSGPRSPVAPWSAGISASMIEELNATSIFKVRYVDPAHMKRIAVLGAIERNRAMSKRARRKAAQHAANVRWAKPVISAY